VRIQSNENSYFGLLALSGEGHTPFAVAYLWKEPNVPSWT